MIGLALTTVTLLVGLALGCIAGYFGGRRDTVMLDIRDDGIGLKDATPYNILFRGPDPVFIDVLSFERRNPGDPTWLPYAQFVRTFLLPLLANKYFGLGLDQILTTRRDGLEPEEVESDVKTAWLMLISGGSSQDTP